MTATPLATTTTAMPAVTASPNALGTPTAVNSAATSPQNKGEMMRGVLLASKLIGMDVQDAQGEGLGEVEDILVEAQTGTVRYLVVGAGGILGLGEKLIPVPVKAFDFQNDYALVNVDRDYLTNAPNFNMDEVYGGAAGWDSSLRSYWDAYTWPVP
jgi:sporulation protein YlmC with PRC-barrel domain